MFNKHKIKISSNKSFGLTFFIVFLIIAIWPILNNGEFRIWSIILSFVFLILGLINSKLLSPLNILWFKFGIMLGAIVAPVVMGIVFFVVVTPTGITMKLLGKDLLGKKYNKKKESYWVVEKKINNSMKNQF
jgi:predicted ferric reductase